jgi:4-alpha-glucanotransferase
VPIRSSGILLHITSLPGAFGIGDLGDPAYRFVDFLCRAGQRVWQVLPLGPLTTGNSPYAALSAFAGNPLLISPERLVHERFLDPSDLTDIPQFVAERSDYDGAARLKDRLLTRAFERYRNGTSALDEPDFAAFRRDHADWLPDFALFTALGRSSGAERWHDWPTDLVRRRQETLAERSAALRDAVAEAEFIQYLFFRQWRDIKRYANERGVRIFGDMPIFVSRESADVWLHQDEFHVDADGRPSLVSGVPPDLFSATGQLWGDPQYRWDRMAATGYAWWTRRLRHALSMFDLLRLDHFRGFEAYWEVPASEATAVRGRWVKGPGAHLFRTILADPAAAPIIAEDLGEITPPVHELREELGFPGMRVLQFGLNEPMDSFHLPHRYPPHSVVYTGTHDNDTILGWAQNPASRRAALRYLGTEGRELHWDLIRLALSSVSELAVFPIQDLLGLGSEARMNTPGEPHGNWTWRVRPDQLTADLENRMRDLTTLYDR